MRIAYDSEVDVLRIRLTDARIRVSDEVEPGFIVDDGPDDQIVGFEILHASGSVQDLATVELDNLRAVAAV